MKKKKKTMRIYTCLTLGCVYTTTVQRASLSASITRFTATTINLTITITLMYEAGGKGDSRGREKRIWCRGNGGRKEGKKDKGGERKRVRWTGGGFNLCPFNGRKKEGESVWIRYKRTVIKERDD